MCVHATYIQSMSINRDRCARVCIIREGVCQTSDHLTKCFLIAILFMWKTSIDCMWCFPPYQTGRMQVLNCYRGVLVLADRGGVLGV